MIKFFRRIRQKLLSENKFSKYLFYAIGEIVLVVIGILIALQINNSNEIRKNRNKEKVILETLLSDLKTNEKLIEEGFADYEWKTSLSEKMANLFGNEFEKEKLVFIDSILYWSAEYSSIELINNSILSLTTSDRLELLQNQSLKQQIVKYPTYIELYKEREDLIRSIVVNEIRPNLEKHISLQKWWNLPETLESDYKTLMNDRTISNNYLNRLFQTRDALERLKKLNIGNDSLISSIKIELKNRFN